MVHVTISLKPFKNAVKHVKSNANHISQVLDFLGKLCTMLFNNNYVYTVSLILFYT